MSNLNELVVGQHLRGFPGGTFNQLVRGERERRQEQQASRNVTQPTRQDVPLAHVMLLWDGTGTLAPGSVVVLGEVMAEPAVDESVPYSGLQFRCQQATGSDDLTAVPFAITNTPIAAGGVGFGHIPNACWAQVTMNDADDDSAELVEDSTLLSSTTGGRVPIIWKPTGTGLKWCIVQLAASGTQVAVIVHGLAGSNVSSGQYTITLSEATVMQGFISSSVTTITAADTHSWGIVDGQLVWVMLEKGLDPSTDIFQTFQAGCPPEA